jgi:aspartate kinase
MSTLIMKFGGSAVGMTIGLTQVLSIVLYEHERWDRLLIVVSALDGVTDALLEAAQLAQLSNRRGYRRIVANLRQRHLSLIEHLPLGVTERNALQADIDQMLFDMLNVCQTMSDHPNEVKPEMVNAVVAVGERLAARIVAALLRQNQLRSVAIDATDLIITDAVYASATPNIQLTKQRITQNLMPMLDRKIIPVITGFIGSTIAGQTTILGRGGSDYTASVLGVCTDADEVWIWTDVDGLMTADPREVGTARNISTLSYEEVAELAYFGARILHARMIDPLRDRQIPLRIRNTFKPQQLGTLIQRQNPALLTGLKAVTSIQGLGLAARYSGSLSAVAALVDNTLFGITGSHADVMISAQSSSHSFVCFVIPTSAGSDVQHSLQIAVEEKLRESFSESVWVVRPVSIVTAIGSQLDHHHALTAEILMSLRDIRILAVAHGPTGYSVSLVTEPDDSDIALARTHEVILRNG